MLDDIIKKMAVVELEPSELAQPISLTDKGDVATVGDLIAEKAPNGIRAMFGMTAAPTSEHVREVGHLSFDALKRVATEMLRRVEPAQRVAAIGLGDYSPQELIEEVDRGTAMGARIVDAVRLNGVFLEAAVANGKVRPKTDHYRNLVFPDFPF
jgi:hypothetical protein